jgi:glycosyltransferase involved in cell wall biosynthesis
VYNGVDISRIDKADAPPIDLPDEPLITTTGRLVNQKNHATLLRAFETVVNQHPETSLLIVGDGPLLEKMEALSKELDIYDSVVFTGYLPRREYVYGVLKQSTLAVYPSWYEGFCVAAVEAMAIGLPIVVSDIEVLREVVGNPGVFADPNDPEAFADTIINLLQDRKNREQHGMEAKDRARSAFPLKRTVHEYYNLYKELTESSNR